MEFNANEVSGGCGVSNRGETSRGSEGAGSVQEPKKSAV